MASGLKTLMDSFGVGSMPWVVRAYLFLTVFLLLMLMLVLSLPTTAEATLITKFFDLLLDLLKLVIGAFLGSLSLSAQKGFAK